MNLSRRGAFHGRILEVGGMQQIFQARSKHSRRSGKVVRLGAIALVLAAFAITGPVARAASGEGEYNAGLKAEQRRDFDEAFHQYQAAVNADPKNPQYQLALERARFQASSIHV